MRKQPLVALGVALCGACSAGEGNGSVSGTIVGNSFPIVDVVSAISDVGNVPAGLIAMSTKPDLCSRVASNTFYRNENILIIEAHVVDEATQTSSAPTSAGLYPIIHAAPGPSAGLSAEFLGSDCTPNNSFDATSGAVTLTYATDGVYNGSFDAFIGDYSNDHVAGSFSPVNCPDLPLLESNNINGTVAVICE